MKIVVLVSSMENGGAERVASTLANYWAGKGVGVAVVPTFPGKGGCFYDLYESVRLVYLTDLLRTGSPNGVLGYLRRLLCLRQFVIEERPDVILSFLPNVNIMTLLATIGIKGRKIICERTDPFVMPVPWALKVARRAVYPLADILVVQTEAVAKKVRRHWGLESKIAIIGNPIPNDLLSVTRKPVLRRNKTLLAVGRLSEEKGFLLLVTLFSRLVVSHPEWVLRIVGDGPLRGALEEVIHATGVERKVELVGQVRDVENEYLLADAFVLSSRYEGFPNALLEAMAVGLPCVSFDCPSGPYEITNGGRAAVLVPPDDAEGMLEALKIFLADESLRHGLSREARPFVAERFSIGSIAAKWESLMVEP